MANLHVLWNLQMKIYSSKKSAFTIAEVLITLSIIGVVAALTVPTLINDTRDREFKEKFRKLYSAVDNAYKLAIQNNGGPLIDVPLYYQPFLNKFRPYLHTITFCPDWDVYEDGYYPGCPTCDPPIAATQPGAHKGHCYPSTKFKYLNGTIYSVSWPDEAGLVLTDGASIIFRRSGTSCSQTTSVTTGIVYNQPLICAYMLIDVNGFGSPNIIGKDIFGIWMLKDRITPFGINDTSAGTCNNSSSGLGCAYEALRQ